MSKRAFTDEDIRSLVKAPNPDERALVVHRLCRRMEVALSPEEREAAHEVLRLMAADAAEVVRRALAVTLKSSNALPRDVALRLATDVDSIALPVLNFSPAFTDDDLAEIVRSGVEARQIAVAARPHLAEAVATAIAGHGCEPAVRMAVANDRADFSERALSTVLDRFAASRDLAAGMAARKVLPLAISERLVNLVTEEVRTRLVDHHALTPATAIRVAVGAHERATVDLVDQAGEAADLPAFCAHLHKQGRLTPSLMLRAVACGHMSFYEQALAELSGLPHHRVWLLVHDAGALGLPAIHEKAGLSPRLLPAFRAAVQTHHELLEEGVELDRLQERMLERFLTASNTVPREDVEHLLERLDRIDWGAAPAAASTQPERRLSVAA